jgi:hypothetical protein
LRDLSERWFAAWLQKDAATVERLAAEDYSYVGPTGLVLDRQAILAVIRPAKPDAWPLCRPVYETNPTTACRAGSCSSIHWNVVEDSARSRSSRC